jgi:hypothetical protein
VLLASYRESAERAARAEAWMPAVVMAGAATEAGLLALTVLCEDDVRAGDAWPRKRRGAEFLSLTELIDIALAMSWLEDDESCRFLREHRMLLHPGRVLRDGVEADVALGPRHWELARAVLDGAVATLGRVARSMAEG